MVELLSSGWEPTVEELLHATRLDQCTEPRVELCVVSADALLLLEEAELEDAGMKKLHVCKLVQLREAVRSSGVSESGCEQCGCGELRAWKAWACPLPARCRLPMGALLPACHRLAIHATWSQLLGRGQAGRGERMRRPQ